eukprot:scaffold106452_cov63-Phaeocystis_antarctica.AAC.1
MALSKLSGDEQRILFTQLCNMLEPRLAVALSSTCNELRTATEVLLQQLRADHEAAAALCLKVGSRSCKELREAKKVIWHYRGLTATDLALLGTLGSVLPALEELYLIERSGAAGPDGMQRLAEGLGAGALPAVTMLATIGMHAGDAGVSALAAALGRGALPQLKRLVLDYAAIGDAGLVALSPALRWLPALERLSLGGNTITDAGLVALAPALRRLPALQHLYLLHNPFGDEGLAALLAPPPPAGAPPTTTGVLTKLKTLDLRYTQITDAGCAALAAAFDSGALPTLEKLELHGVPASAAAKVAVQAALTKSKAAVSVL